MAKNKKEKIVLMHWDEVKTEVLNLVKCMKKGDEQAEAALLQKMRTDSRYLKIVRKLARSKKRKGYRGSYARININNINRGGVWGYRN